MNARLKTIFEDAEAVLSTEDQERLADVVEAFMANCDPDPKLTPEQLSELERRFNEPFAAAPEEDVRAFFARYGH